MFHNISYANGSDAVGSAAPPGARPSSRATLPVPGCGRLTRRRSGLAGLVIGLPEVGAHRAVLRLALAFLLLWGLAARAAAEDIRVSGGGIERPSGMTECMGLSAFSADPDPAGLNMRSGPSVSAPVIGVLREQVFARDAMGRELRQAPVFRILGSYRGWLLVDDLAYPDAPSADDEAALPSGPGWVFGARVMVRSFDETSPTARLYARPDGKGASQVIAGHGFAVLGCEARWLHVSERVPEGLKPAQSPLTGWLAAPDICVAQMTRAKPVNICRSR